MPARASSVWVASLVMDRVLRPCAVVLAAVSSVLLIASVSSCSRKIVVVQPIVPTTFALEATTSSEKPLDRSKESLTPIAAGVPTTAIGFAPGNASITGMVRGPNGPAAGAIVQIERVSEGQSITTQLIADGSGRYVLNKALLGRIRVRAWRAPDLAMATEKALFTQGATKFDIDLTSYKHSDLRWAVAPSPLLVGRAATVVVQLSERVVNDLGRVVVIPVGGVGVSLLQQGVVQIASLEERITDERGRVSFRLACNEPGPSTIIARLAIGGEASLELPPCILVTIPPTTVAPSVGIAIPTVVIADTIPPTVLTRVPIRTIPPGETDPLPPPISLPPVEVNPATPTASATPTPTAVATPIPTSAPSVPAAAVVP